MPLKQLFSKFAVRVDRKMAEQIIRWKLLYETRGSHADALNTPLLGVDRINFLPKDAQELFDIVGINVQEFNVAIRASTIDPSFHVASNDFNLLIVWLVYNAYMSDLIKADLKNMTARALFFMLQVKFFSSLMHHYLKYPADRKVMEATIDSLSEKYDIKHKETSTWKLLMEARCVELTSPSGLHWRTLHSFVADKDIIYVLSDVQTRLRTKVRNVMMVYFDLKEKGVAIGDSSLIGEDPEGQKIIKELNNSYDSMVAALCAMVLNAQRLLRTDYLKIIKQLIPNCDVPKMRNLLMMFSVKATVQYQKRQSDAMSKDGTLFEGYHILIQNLIQSTYRRCIMEKINLKSRYAILKKSIEIYRSSRINDPLINQVRDSIQAFVNSCKLSSRDATNASLRIGLATYFIFLSFDCR